MIPEEGPSPGAAAPKRPGASRLDAGAFLSKKEKEAMQRAKGGTPTLDRKGQRHVTTRALAGDVVRMNTELEVRGGGLPGWAWALLAVAVLSAGLGGVWTYLWHEREAAIAAETAAVKAAQQRARSDEEARLRRMNE